jgi:GNAT superfamily N-acetyltransferase
MTVSAGSKVRFVHVRQDDELAAPLLSELAVEYATRYGGSPDAILGGLRNYPSHEFQAPSGGLLIGLLDGQPVTGGAFRRFGVVDGLETAELKRIWTDNRFRRKGYASRLLDALEAEIVSRGYRRIYLTTGDRQPEAEALYLARGYTRLAEPLPAVGEVYPVAFEKLVQP